MTESSGTPVDPATLPRDDPRLDQRWPTTLDGVSTDEAAEIVRLLDAGIACHVETVSPRISGMAGHVAGLYDVLVREEDLRPAAEVLKPAFPERFPGEKRPDDSLWPGAEFGDDPRVLCRLSWAQSWDLTAALGRTGIKAIVLPDDEPPPEPPASETLGDMLKEETHELIAEGGGLDGHRARDAAADLRGGSLVRRRGLEGRPGSCRGTRVEGSGIRLRTRRQRPRRIAPCPPRSRRVR